MASNTHLSPTSATQTRPNFFRSVSSSSFKRDKPRLYLALYSKGGSAPSSTYNANVTCDSYHWALVVGPKTASRTDPGICYQLLHSSNGSNPTSSYEETDLSRQSPSQSQALLVRITLAKVLDEDRVQLILRNLRLSSPMSSCSESTSSTSSEHDHTSTCLNWVRTAFRHLTSDSSKPLRCYIGPEEWNDVEARARKYAKKKRTQGRFNTSANIDPEDIWWDPDEVATWNYWENRETTV